MSSEERLNPVVDVISNEKLGEIAQECNVADGIKRLEEIKCNNNDVWVEFQKC